MNVPYCIVKGKARLGAVVHKKTATALALTGIKNEDKMEFSQLVEAIKGSYNDKFDKTMRTWGGGTWASSPRRRLLPGRRSSTGRRLSVMRFKSVAGSRVPRVPTACGDGGCGVHCRVAVTFGGDLDNRVKRSRPRYFSPLVLLTAPRPARSAPRPSSATCGDLDPDLDTSVVDLRRLARVSASAAYAENIHPSRGLASHHCQTGQIPEFERAEIHSLSRVGCRPWPLPPRPRGTSSPRAA